MWQCSGVVGQVSSTQRGVTTPPLAADFSVTISTNALTVEQGGLSALFLYGQQYVAVAVPCLLPSSFIFWCLLPRSSAAPLQPWPRTSHQHTTTSQLTARAAYPPGGAREVSCRSVRRRRHQAAAALSPPRCVPPRPAIPVRRRSRPGCSGCRLGAAAGLMQEHLPRPKQQRSSRGVPAAQSSPVSEPGSRQGFFPSCSGPHGGQAGDTTGFHFSALVTKGHHLNKLQGQKHQRL